MKLNNWEGFWNSYRKKESQNKEDLFFQVGKTINKIPIADSLFQDMVEDIIQNLQLNDEDVLMELCCGNGIITLPLSTIVKQIYAFDFTDHLIESAKKHSQQSNINYTIGNAKSDFMELFQYEKKPRKFLMNDSLGYFEPNDLVTIIKKINCDSFLFYITGVPCDELKWNFYNTPERKNHYLKMQTLEENYNDGIGKWWKVEEIKTITDKLGLKVTIHNQPAAISNFRMNILISK